MDIIKALSIFNFSDITKLDEKELKKRYRTTLKKYHPDNNNGDESKAVEIVKANEILVRALKEIKAYEEFLKSVNKPNIISILPFETVGEIYNGKSITLGSEDDAVELNKSGLLKNDIYIMIMYEAGLKGGVLKNYTSIQKVNVMRNYDIDCFIDVSDLASVEFEIKIYGKTLSYKVDAEALRVNIKLENETTVRLTLRKKLVSLDSEGGNGQKNFEVNHYRRTIKW